MNYVMFERVANRLRADGHVRIFLHAEDTQGRDAYSVYKNFGFDKKDLVSRWRANLSGFDMLVSADPGIPSNRARHKVHIFHGISFKGKAFNPDMSKFDYLFLFGDYHRRRFVEKGIFSADDPRLAMIGMPKVDALVDGSLDQTAIQKRLGIDPSRPTILYAPTWSSRNSLSRWYLDIVDSVSQLDVNFLIKLHDWTRWPKTMKVDWEAKIAELERAGKCFKLVTELNVVPLLYVSDLLISDASSVANEYTLLDRPIVFIDVPDLIEKYQGTIDLDTWGRRTGEIVHSPTDLQAVIRHALDHPDMHGEVRRAAARDYFHDPGRATDRAVAMIYRILGLEGTV